MKQKKTSSLTMVTCTPEFKEMAEKLCEPMGLSMAAYIRLLIIQEAERTGVKNIVRQ